MNPSHLQWFLLQLLLWGNYEDLRTLQWRWRLKSAASRLFAQRLYRRKSKKTSKLRVTGLYAGNSPVTGEFPTQRASNAKRCFHLMTPSCKHHPGVYHVNHTHQAKITHTRVVFTDTQYNKENNLHNTAMNLWINLNSYILAYSIHTRTHTHKRTHSMPRQMHGAGISSHC